MVIWASVVGKAENKKGLKVSNRGRHMVARDATDSDHVRIGTGIYNRRSRHVVESLECRSVTGPIGSLSFLLE